MNLELDHVVVAVADIDTAAARLLNSAGLASLPGGRHPGHGTGNRIVPLGRSYLEFMGVVDEAEAAGSPMGAWILARAGYGDGPVGVCFRTDDIDRLAEDRGIPTFSMSRALRDGRELKWRLAGLEWAITDGLPFFIQWDVSEEDLPGRVEAPHRVSPQGFEKVTLSGDAARVHEWLGGPHPQIEITPGEPGVISATIATSSGPVYVRTPD